MTSITRRDCLKHIATAGAAIAASLPADAASNSLFFKIALGEYSFNPLFRAGKYDPLQLASLTRKEFGLSAIDYVSSFWEEKAQDRNFLRELKKRAGDNGITNHIILVDLPQPELGDLDARRRKGAVEAHRPWIDVARFLGCSGIRVNLNEVERPGQKEAVLEASVDGYGRLLEYGAQHEIDVLVQNHLGYSCDPNWLVRVMQQVNNKHAGVEADPGHFQELFIVNKPQGGHTAHMGQSFDLYAGLQTLMPYSKAVNAKTHAFDAHGNETSFDYSRILKIVKSAGYSGFIGIEWEPAGEGKNTRVFQGILDTKALLEKDGSLLS
ncbi:MAG TPA: TIM barrel protein [Bryobacteraceae bacterium]|nr:TIM barrel protein [Bryobacteraceae bacterium]